MTSPETIAAITEVARAYMAAMTAGDRTALERLFHEKASEIGHYEGELLWNSREAFITMCEEAADPDAEVFWVIRNIAVHGDIAFVHVEDDWAGLRFDDFLTLLNHDGAWRVVAKAFHVRS